MVLYKIKVLLKAAQLKKVIVVIHSIDNRPYLAVVNRLEANVESQQSVLDKSRRDVERLKPLYEQDAASQLDFDNAISILSQAKSSLGS
ncbi:hypothetical protein PEC18_38025 [Paucibacter sp. O1-1]|nr:hypothetical protein [Paucibacter sp. O1-1]MDA3831425.1 hypothetical protein [Paucibacter sp. O1-1]